MLWSAPVLLEYCQSFAFALLFYGVDFTPSATPLLVLPYSRCTWYAYMVLDYSSTGIHTQCTRLEYVICMCHTCLPKHAYGRIYNMYCEYSRFAYSQTPTPVYSLYQVLVLVPCNVLRNFSPRRSHVAVRTIENMMYDTVYAVCIDQWQFADQDSTTCVDNW